MLNPYFLHGSKSEQGLIQDLVNEQLRMFGQEVIYMPRQYIREQSIIRELITSKFEQGYPIEAYLANPDGFGGQGDILSKFGVRSTDEITLVISKERYELNILPFLKQLDNRKSASRPQEGDLIYFPLDNSIFEVKYVEGKKPFYQLNNLYVYELRCEIFEYEDEVINTNIDEVDRSVKNFGYIQTLTMVPSSSTIPTATVGLSTDTLSSRSVSYIDVINPGSGYRSTPTVRISPAPSGGRTATAVATLVSRNRTTYIDKILITDPGYGYTRRPTVSIISDSGSGFIGTAVLSTGTLGVINITNGGSGFSSSPNVSISTSPTGNNATAISYITATGIVTAIRYTNAGAGYTTNPIITIQSPIGVSTGTYNFNEVVTGSKTGTKGTVKEWDSQNRILKVSIIDGDFALNETIVGSAGSYTVYSIEKDNLYDPYFENDEIEEEADKILDFTESNPFGKL